MNSASAARAAVRDVGEGGWKSPLAVAGWIALAAIWSVLRKGYRFDGYFADDQTWNALLIDRLHPGLLHGDPLIELIAERYASGLLDAMVLLAPFADLPIISIVLFAIARFATCAGIFTLTRTLTGSVASGIMSAFFVAGAWIAYFGGVNFVESILTPRGVALPFALFALDAYLRRRPFATTSLLAACLYVHPVTGVNLLGIVAFCELFFRERESRRGFGLGIALLFAELLWIGLRTGELSGDGAGLRFDAAWAEVIAATVGPWVYLHRIPAGFAVACAWILVFGAFGVVYTGTQALRTAAIRFSIAACAAIAIHIIAVDLLNLRLMLQLSPQRAGLAMAAVAVAAVGHWTAQSIRDGDPVRRAFGIAFLLSSVLLADLSLSLVFGVLLSIAWWPPSGRLLPGVRKQFAVALVAGIAVFFWPSIRESFHLRPERIGPHLVALSTLGVDEDWASVQRYIREHSEPGEAVMAPPALSPRVFAQRPSTMRLKMQSFTYVSRPYAFRFDAWQRDIGIPLLRADTREALDLARRAAARWLVLDDRETPVSARDPRPDTRSGPYRAYSIPAASKATSVRARGETR